MYCGNCKRDIGNEQTCPHCGYNYLIDNYPYEKPDLTTPAFMPRPIEIQLIASKNTMATLGLVFALIGMIPFAGLFFMFLSLIFTLIGFGKVKRTRSGMGKCVAATIIRIVILIAYYVAMNNL